ncbi:hypothetical protein HETIRDRAFT_114546 [Heterobasidion irregulare TC 32-1]|uniref:Uncharacterized protein n=1 Tax=Heterobasidion irregulare (strain TC 32-1) TaxID=747525 RepID=W4KP03_HETIT|nr:uncharacterized protein HETIRDRAFT_114546 [Heterobasidion irregulare TC 32-1]ETW87429.1 hypothetical protein HETIRDRAFT_114546 [Heterobasidion irregulare TC 32-1]
MLGGHGADPAIPKGAGKGRGGEENELNIADAAFEDGWACNARRACFVDNARCANRVISPLIRTLDASRKSSRDQTTGACDPASRLSRSSGLPTYRDVSISLMANLTYAELLGSGRCIHSTGEPNRLVPDGHRGYTLIRDLKMGRKIPWISEHDGSNLALAADSSWTADNARKGTQISGEGVAMEGADQTSAVRPRSEDRVQSMEAEGLLWGGGRRVVGDGRSLAQRRGEKQAILAVSYARRPKGLMGVVNRTGQRELTSIARGIDASALCMHRAQSEPDESQNWALLSVATAAREGSCLEMLVLSRPSRARGTAAVAYTMGGWRCGTMWAAVLVKRVDVASASWDGRVPVWACFNRMRTHSAEPPRGTGKSEICTPDGSPDTLKTTTALLSRTPSSLREPVHGFPPSSSSTDAVQALPFSSTSIDRSPLSFPNPEHPDLYTRERLPAPFAPSTFQSITF